MRLWLIKSLSIIILFVILIPGCRKKNQPPYAPYTPSGPKWGLVGITYEFSSLAIDPDGDSVAIKFDIQQGGTSTWSRFVATEDSVEISFSWPEPGTYYVKVQAKDVNENLSNWSLPHYIMINLNQPPYPPSIPSGPSIGCVDTFYLFSSSAVDSVSDSVAIRFDWGDGDTSEWSYLAPSMAPVLRAHSWLYPDTYYVRAQAKDKAAQISEWSDEHQIIIFIKMVKN